MCLSSGCTLHCLLVLNIFAHGLSKHGCLLHMFISFQSTVETALPLPWFLPSALEACVSVPSSPSICLDLHMHCICVSFAPSTVGTTLHCLLHALGIASMWLFCTPFTFPSLQTVITAWCIFSFVLTKMLTKRPTSRILIHAPLATRTVIF